MPPAASTISGTQCPPTNGGWDHSRQNTLMVGNRSAISFTRATRARMVAVSSCARWRASSTFAHRLDLRDDVVQGVRVERDDLGVGESQFVEGAFDLAARHRADAAEVLGQDHVGAFPAQEILVQDVERVLRVHPLPHGVVDLPRRERPALGEGAPGNDGFRDGVGWVVALVGHADQIGAHPEGVDDLGRRGQQGHDLHRGKSRSRAGS